MERNTEDWNSDEWNSDERNNGLPSVLVRAGHLLPVVVVHAQAPQHVTSEALNLIPAVSLLGPVSGYQLHHYLAHAVSHKHPYVTWDVRSDVEQNMGRKAIF